MYFMAMMVLKIIVLIILAMEKSSFSLAAQWVRGSMQGYDLLINNTLS